MKKLCFLLVLLTAFAAQAQAPLNYGFEAVNADGSPRNWGNVYLFTLGDSVVFDQHLIQVSSDAYVGRGAVELRNAYNYSANRGIAGSISLDADSVFSAWGSFELVPVPAAPASLGFWYQFSPVNGDTARALLQIFDSTGYEIGSALALLTTRTADYTYVQVPVNYPAGGQAAFMMLNFSTFYTADASGTRQPSLGTRLLLDEVAVSTPLGLVGNVEPSTDLLYPNPATDVLRVKGTKPLDALELFDSSGRLVRRVAEPRQVSLTGLVPGLYVARLLAADGTVQTQRVMKQ